MTSSRRKRLANTLTACRSALGANALPVGKGSIYRLGPGVSADTAIFDRHVRASRLHDVGSAEARAELRLALELVDGTVFATRSAERASYVWVDMENWIATWELKIAEIALTLSESSVDAGDYDEAVWAAEAGLRALPSHVQLTEALMSAYASRGDTAAARRVYASHVASLEQLDLDDVAESTQRLSESIRARDTA